LVRPVHYVGMSKEIVLSKKEVIYLSADWHPTYDPPRCRLETEEEWMGVQTDAVQQVARIVGNDLLIVAGDIVDSYKQKNAQLIINMLNDNLPKNTVITMGNHAVHGCGQDREKALSDGTFGTLTRMKNINYITEPYEYGKYVLYPHDFKHGETLKHNEVDTSKVNVAISHFLSFEKQVPKHWDKVEAWTAPDILKEFPEYNLICVGDYHIPFNVEDRYLSPGSLTRRTIGQVEYRPAIWRYDGETLEPIYLKVKPAEDCISRAHKIKQDERNERMEELTDNIISSTEWNEAIGKENSDKTLDFEVDLQQHFLVNKTKRPVQDLVNKMIVYKRLLTAEKMLVSIRKGKDYSWLTNEYNKVDAFIDDMKVVKFDLDKKEK